MGYSPWGRKQSDMTDTYTHHLNKSLQISYIKGFPGGSVVRNPSANAEDLGSVSGLGRSPGEENGSPLQYSCLGNPVDRGAWWATGHGVARVRHD